MVIFEEIIAKYYPQDDNLRRLLVHHSEQVTRRALSIADRHPALELDRSLLENAGMLHDIGIFLCDAPSIFCHGTEPYLLHGKLGADLMRREGALCDPEDMQRRILLGQIARVCERHTGTGLTAQNIREQGLPLPEMDFVPETMEEIVVCYADKFYSKSHPERERTVEQTAQSLEKFGHKGVEKFLKWTRILE